MIAPLRDLAAVFTLAFTLASAGCNARPLTQLVVVTESSLNVPSELDQIEIDVTSPSGVMGYRMAAIASVANLPATLGVVHRDGPLGPVHIRVRGLARDMVIVTREADVTLQEGRTLRLDLPLDASCRGVVCPADQSCAAGACRTLTIAPSELVDFNGTLQSSPDTGFGDAGFGDAGSTDADFTDAGSIDAATADASTLPMCPASCGNPMHAEGVCMMGICVLVCEAQRSDCNGVYEDGCETNTRNSDMHCGACDRPCVGTERCQSGACE